MVTVKGQASKKLRKDQTHSLKTENWLKSAMS